MQTENAPASKSRNNCEPTNAAQEIEINFESGNDTENHEEDRELAAINEASTFTEANSAADIAAESNTSADAGSLADTEADDDATLTPAKNFPPPCYFWNVCAERAALEKVGRAVCSKCAQNLNGFEYPLRAPSRAPLYKTGRAVAEAMSLTD